MDYESRGSTNSRQHKIERQVSTKEAELFAKANDLLWLGETSCYDNKNNCGQIFDELLKKIHIQ